MNRHEPLATQHDHLARVIRGHRNYYGRTVNSARLSSFRSQVIHCWNWALSRRSSKDYVNRDGMNALLRQFPAPQATLAPFVRTSADANLPAEEPSA